MRSEDVFLLSGEFFLFSGDFFLRSGETFLRSGDGFLLGGDFARSGDGEYLPLSNESPRADGGGDGEFLGGE